MFITDIVVCQVRCDRILAHAVRILGRDRTFSGKRKAYPGKVKMHPLKNRAAGGSPKNLFSKLK
jgi:hypothetical protein